MTAASTTDGKGSLGRAGGSRFSDSSEFSFQFSGFLLFSQCLIDFTHGIGQGYKSSSTSIVVSHLQDWIAMCFG